MVYGLGYLVEIKLDVDKQELDNVDGVTGNLEKLFLRVEATLNN